MTATTAYIVLMLSVPVALCAWLVWDAIRVKREYRKRHAELDAQIRAMKEGR